MVTTTCPYWTPHEQATLVRLINKGAPLADIAFRLRRSEDAIKMKLKRLGVAVPEKCLAKKPSDKVTAKATTTTAPIKPTEDLISPEEAMKMWLGCVKRLNNPDVTSQEVKKIRLILTSLKGYVVICRDYVERIMLVEEGLRRMTQQMIAHWEMQKNRAQTEKEKAKCQELIDDLKADYKEMAYPEQYHIWPRRAAARKRLKIS